MDFIKNIIHDGCPLDACKTKTASYVAAKCGGYWAILKYLHSICHCPLDGDMCGYIASHVNRNVEIRLAVRHMD